MIKGYKCFNEDFTNNYGFKFEIGAKYSVKDRDIQFGLNGNGFHMCKNMEETFIYFDAMNNNVIVCEVIGYGNFQTIDDEYKGYQDMYSVEKIEIVRQLSREEIVNYGINLIEFRLMHFLQNFKLTKEEILLFEQKFINNSLVLNCIEYYQKDNKKVYMLKK